MALEHSMQESQITVSLDLHLYTLSHK